MKLTSTGGSQNIKLCLILVSISLYHTIFIQGVALFYWPGLKLPQSDVLQVKKHPHQLIFHHNGTSLKIIVFETIFHDLQINSTYTTIMIYCSSSLPATRLNNMIWTSETSLALRWISRILRILSSFEENSPMITFTFTLFFGKWLPVQIFGIGWKLLEDTEFCFRCERVRSTAWTCRLGINLESWCQQYFEYFSHFLHCGHSFIQTSGLFGEPMLRIMGTPLILGIEAF